MLSKFFDAGKNGAIMPAIPEMAASGTRSERRGPPIVGGADPAKST